MGGVSGAMAAPVVAGSTCASCGVGVLRDLAGPVAVAIALVALAVVAVVAVRTRPRRPQPTGATPDLPDDLPPGVVNLLTEGYEPTTEAGPATLLDLAARRHVGIEQLADGTVLLRLRSPSRPDELSEAEAHVLDHLRRRAHGGVVPAAALAFPSEAAARRWHSELRDHLVRAARDRGLCRPRWPVWLRATLTAGTLSTLALALVAGGDEGSLRLGEVLALAAFFSLLGADAVVLGSDRQRDTDAGHAVASAWAGVRRYLADSGSFGELPPGAVVLWDRYLAHAAAFGPAPNAVQRLPLGAEDDRRAWSTASGGWRRVEVRYPRLRPGWGRHPGRAVLASLVRGGCWAAVAWLAWSVALDPTVGGGGGLGSGAGRWVTLVGATGGTLALALAAVQLWVLVLAVADLGGREVVVEGVALRRRRRRGLPPYRTSLTSGWRRPDEGDPHGRHDRCYLAIDDGRSAVVDALAVTRDLWDDVAQGQRVRAEVTPRLRWVRSLAVVAAATPPPVGAGGAVTGAPDAPGTDPALAARAADLAARHADPGGDHAAPHAG